MTKYYELRNVGVPSVFKTKNELLEYLKNGALRQDLDFKIFDCEITYSSRSNEIRPVGTMTAELIGVREAGFDKIKWV